MSDTTPLTPEERRQAELLQAKVAKEGSEQHAKLVQDKQVSDARWKIQVWIKSERSIFKPLSFTLTFWESGKRLHGGGDETAFVCRRKPSAPKPKMPFAAARPKGVFKAEPTNDGCDTIIPGGDAVRGLIVCPNCGLQWDTEHIADAIFYQVPVERAADVIAEWFRKLQFSADIYVKYRDQDIRVKMMAASYGLRKARELKGLTIYPLDSILRDTTGGATLESRFKALLLA
jgi:hypothetical protein